MKKYFGVFAVILLAVMLMTTGAMASGEIGIGKVIDDNDIFNLSARYNFNDNFYVKGNMDFNSDLDDVTNKEYEIGGKVAITEMATLLGSYESNSTSNGDQITKTAAIDTKITKSIITRTQYEQVDSVGKTTLKLLYIF